MDLDQSHCEKGAKMDLETLYVGHIVLHSFFPSTIEDLATCLDRFPYRRRLLCDGGASFVMVTWS